MVVAVVFDKVLDSTLVVLVLVVRRKGARILFVVKASTENNSVGFVMKARNIHAVIVEDRSVMVNNNFLVSEAIPEAEAKLRDAIVDIQSVLLVFRFCYDSSRLSVFQKKLQIRQLYLLLMPMRMRRLNEI